MGNIDKLYRISRILLALLVYIVIFVLEIINIVSYNSDYSLIEILGVPIIYSTIMYLISFITTIYSKGILWVGNKIQSVLVKIFYYLAILIFVCFLFLVTHFIFNDMLYSSDPFYKINNGIYHALSNIAIFFGIILPYFQTLIVLGLGVFIKDNDGNNA